MREIEFMRRTLLLAAGLLMVRGLGAQDRDLGNVEIKVSKIAGSIYLLQGAGGNIAASVGDDGIVLVDDESAPLSDKIQAARSISRLNPGPKRHCPSLPTITP
jgi:cyclase